jgi:molecular chaperone GrpE
VTGVNIEDKNNHTEKTGDNEIFLNNSDSAAGKNQDQVTQVQAGREYEETLKEAVEEPGEDDLSILQKQLEEQKNRAEDFYNRLARLQADYENFRRRTRLEKEDLCKYASEQLVLKLLPVLDNFERALEAEGDSLKDYKSGVEMIYRQFQDVLSLEGVEAIPAVGEPFDPVKHEAVFREESEEYPENTIIEELRRGYVLKDKVIRPSMVKVSKSL